MFAYVKNFYYICNINHVDKKTRNMEESVANRLKLFIDTTGVTSTQFADMCGIPRPTLSQLLSGRNKKISDILVGQIHRAFPELSILWLLFGEGPVKIKSLTNGTSDERRQYGDMNVSGSNSADISLQRHSDPEDMPFPGFEDVSGGTDFSSDSNILTEGQNYTEYSNVRGLNINKNADISSKNQVFESDLKIMDLKRQIEQLRQNPRKVVQITIYYDDSTFETFVPK